MKVTSEHIGHSITLEGSKEEIDTLKSALLGINWFAQEEGEIITHTRLISDPWPPQAPDPTLFDHWPTDEHHPKYIIGRHPCEKERKGYHPSIFIQGISGYDGNEAYMMGFQDGVKENA